MKLAKTGLRRAVLKAAKKLEEEPELYNFYRLEVPKAEKECGCILGWIGFYINQDFNLQFEDISDVCEIVFGYRGAAPDHEFGSMEYMLAIPGIYTREAACAAARLRYFANHTYR